jgi:hypothetical protein
MKLLESFSRGDGSHWGLSDWYEDGERELREALEKREPFDTDWYSSKKEIASARIFSPDGELLNIEVSVSDDFDTEGHGSSSAEVWCIDHIVDALQEAWGKAVRDQQNNAVYCGFKVLRFNPEGHASWLDDYLVNIGDGELTEPPGDYYYNWGWVTYQDKKGNEIPHRELPAETVKAFEEWAHKWAFDAVEEESLRIGEWEIRPWSSELGKGGDK